MILETFLAEKFFLFFLVFARVGGFLLLTPVVGGKTLPRMVRFYLAILLTLTALPSVWTAAVPDASKFFTVAISLGTEFLIGLTAGAGLAIFLAAFSMAGDLIGRLGGFSVASSFDPAFGESVPVLSTFLLFLGTTVFVLTGGLDGAVVGLIDSFGRRPLGAGFDVEAAGKIIVSLLSLATTIALKTAAPAILASLSVWLTAGLLGRTLGALHLMPIVFSGNALLTLAVLHFGLAASLAMFHGEIPGVLRLLFESR